MVLVVSGGVSLGAYQGGLNWALIELMRKSQEERFRDLVNAGVRRDHGYLRSLSLAEATGASAGNINALLSAIEWCRAASYPRPEASLFWLVWVQTGWEQLFAQADSTSLDSAIFHRVYFQRSHFPAIQREMAGGAFRDDCDVPVGIAVTKLASDSLRLTKDSPVWAATQRFVSTFRVTRNRLSDTLHFEQIERVMQPGWDPGAFGKLVVLPSMGGTDRIPFDEIAALVEASGAFPYAFAPVSLTYWDARDVTGSDSSRGSPEPGCQYKQFGCQLRTELFVDGGVFDNNPLDLAFGLDNFINADINARLWRALRQLPFFNLDSARFRYNRAPRQVIFINPGILRNPLSSRRTETTVAERSTRGVGALTQLFFHGLTAATQYELQSLARSLAHDTVYYKARWIHTTSRSSPIVGEHMQHFAAFLGRPFREYDFFVGAYDGFDYIARDVICARSPEQSTSGPSTTTTGRASSPVPQAGINLDKCVASAVRGLVEAESDVLGPLAPAIFDSLYFEEHREHLSSAVGASGPLPISSTSSATDTARAKLLLGLYVANKEQYNLVADSSCGERPLAEQMICGDKMDSLALAFARVPDIKAIVDTAAKHVECGPSHWSTAPTVPTCYADNTLRDLVEDPYGFADRLVDKIIVQGARVERLLKTQKRPNHPAVPSWVRYAYLGYVAAPPSAWQLDPSSVPKAPAGQTWWGHAMPFEFNLNVDQGGVEALDRPTWQFSSTTALAFPLTLTNWRPGTAGYTPQLFSGIGLTPLFKTGNPVLSSVQVGGEVLANWVGSSFPTASLAMIGDTIVNGWHRERAIRFSTSIGLYFAADRLRLGVRWLPWTSRALFMGGHVAVTFGLSDFNGLLYWLLTSAH